MAASLGHGPVLGPPPSPDSLVNKAALAGLVFSTEPKKFRTFSRQFRAAIGPQYKTTLEAAIRTGDLQPTNAAAIVMHHAIYDMLVLTFKDEDDILDEMIAQCGTYGPACLAYLEGQYNSTGLAATVKNFGAIVREQIHGPSHIAGLIALNTRYARLQFTSEQLTALILLKLPDKYSTIKTMVLQSDTLPTPTELQGMLQTESEFSGDGGHAALAGIGVHRGNAPFCYNCDESGHLTRNCVAAKVTCDECGDKGHQAKHCFVRNDKPLPSNMDEAKKQRIADKRIAYKAAGKACMTTTETAAATAAEVAAQIREDKDFLSALQRLDL